MFNKQNKKKGVSLIEVVIGISIIVMAVIASFLYYTVALRVAEQSTDRTQATFLLSEGAEAIRIIRDSNWENLSSLMENTDYHFIFTDGSWQATTTPQIINNKFTRTFRVFSVSRDTNDEIVESGGEIDPGIKKIRISVGWNSRQVLLERDLSMYIADIFRQQ